MGERTAVAPESGERRIERVDLSSTVGLTASETALDRLGLENSPTHQPSHSIFQEYPTTG